jgi:hypothetical protein
MEDDKLVATLYSDDPHEALRRNYTGNSFYLKMDLEIVDAAELGKADWSYRSASSGEREDSPYGIFLSGRQTQVQPFDVRARFRSEADGTVTVVVGGQFQVVTATSDAGPARMATVMAELSAVVDQVAEKP